MGLKCSLLGHRYGESETEREREERGDEVVETVRTVEVCERCGAERVVSENTEVRSVSPAPAPEDDAPDAEAADENADATAETAADADVGVDLEEGPSAEEDDGVILDDDGDAPETAAAREPGAWPASDDTRANERSEGAPSESGDAGPANRADERDEDAEFIDADAEADAADGDADATDEHDPWPDQEGEDEGFAAETATSGGADVSLGGGLTPEADGAVADGVDDEERMVEAGSGIASAGELDAEGGSREQDGELVCPECGERTSAAGSSLRAGDICPECHRGYLTEE